MKLIDIRTEKVVKRFEETDLMTCGTFGNKKAIISAGGQLAVLITPNGQIVAFDIDKENVVGCLGMKSDENGMYKNYQTSIRDFSWQPRGNKVATINK